MSLLKNSNLEEFAAELASNSATPGGGSAAALSGALGAALVSMVCRLTIGKKGYEDYFAELEEVLGLAEDLRTKLIEAVDVDAGAYGKVMNAFRLPKDTEDQKKDRTAAVQSAFKEACESPRRTSLWSLDVLRLCARIASKVNVNAASDLGVGATQALAGLEGACMNVLINLPSIKDEEYVELLKREVEETEEEGRILKSGVMREVLGYIGGAS